MNIERTPQNLPILPDDGHLYEWIDGIAVARNVSIQSNRIGLKCAVTIGQFVEQQRLGWMFAGALGYRCFTHSRDPNRIRIANASFVSFMRMPAESYEDEEYCSIVPDLVVEVISPNDLASEVEAKRDEWLAAGVRSVWIVDPISKTVRIERHDGSYARYRHNDKLVDEPVLPGFAVPVVDFFRKPG
jgi:Uma2 family endonuclease